LAERDVQISASIRRESVARYREDATGHALHAVLNRCHIQLRPNTQGTSRRRVIRDAQGARIQFRKRTRARILGIEVERKIVRIRGQIAPTDQKGRAAVGGAYGHDTTVERFESALGKRDSKSQC